MYTNIPKYQKIKNIIQEDISKGIYRPGEAIPSDNDFMKKFSVSKSTITQALKLLAQEGYIVREQGKGSFVTDRSASTVITLFICPTEHKEEDFWNEIVDSYNKSCHTFQVKLEFIYNDLVPLRDTLFKAFAGGNAPDIFSLDGPDVSYWAYMNSLKPLDKFITEDFKDRFVPNIIRQGTYKNKLYHLGYNESSLCIIYNKKLFRELNIYPPKSIEEAWSWEEFLEVCFVIKDKSNVPYPLLMDSGRGLADRQGEWISYSLLSFIMQNNGSVFNEDCTKTNGYLNGSFALEAMEWVGKLFHTYHYTHTEDIADCFPGNFAMSLSLPNAFLEALDTVENDHIGIIPLPRNKKAATPHGGWGLCMSNQTKYPEECFQFMKYVFTLENQLKLYKYTGMPVLKDIYEIYKDFNATADNTNILFSQLHHTSFTRPLTPAYPFFSKVFTTSCVKIADGGNVKEILDEASEQVDMHLSRHNYFLET